MQCNCGDITEARTFTVTTLDQAIEWYPLAQPEHLPITITLDTCRGCGRARRKVFSNEKLLWTQG